MPGLPHVREDLTVVVLDGEAVVYDDETGDLHHLNPSATLVFQLCDGSGSARDLASDIAEVYGVGLDVVLPQVRETIERFGAAGLLVGVERRASEDATS